MLQKENEICEANQIQWHFVLAHRVYLFVDLRYEDKTDTFHWFDGIEP